MKLISACLAGVNCRWDGESRPPLPKILKLLEDGEAILVCPEQLGGLSTPRTPSEQLGEKIIAKDGTDVTKQFQRGAEEGLKIAKLAKCNEAILKSKSPSCGSGKVYDGSFTGKLVDGDGVFTKLLKKNGIKVMTEEKL
jgi:uncharacterized protein YbbK (DUF523 family)